MINLLKGEWNYWSYCGLYGHPVYEILFYKIRQIWKTNWIIIWQIRSFHLIFWNNLKCLCSILNWFTEEE